MPRVQADPENRQGWARRLSAFLLAIILMLLVLRTGVGEMQAAEARAEKQRLQPILALLDLPADAPQEQLFDRLSDHAAAQQEARQARLARAVGLYPDWDSIFLRIGKLEGVQRANALHILAQEYGVSPDLPLDQIKRIVVSQQRSFPMTKAMSGPIGAAQIPQ